MQVDLARLLVVVTAVGVSLGIEFASRAQAVSLSSVLFYRGIFGVLLIAIWLRPSLRDLRVCYPGSAFIRLVAGGLSFVGWFGAIEQLSAPLAVALLQLDLIALGLARYPIAANASRVADFCLFVAVLIYAVFHLIAADSGSAALLGLVYAGIGILGRTVSQYVWQRSCERGEHPFMRMTVPLVGGSLAGLALADGFPHFDSSFAVGTVLFTAVCGAIGYGAGDVVIAYQGAYQRRVLEAVAVGGLACSRLVVSNAGLTALNFGLITLLTFCAGWSAACSRRT